jgi:transposase-like protein
LVGRCSSPNFQTDAGVAEVMTALRGSATIARLSQELGVSRFTVGRWLKAQVTPSFAEFLQFLDVTTLRLVDFCAELVNPERLPSISEQHEKLKAARQLAYDYPWSHAVLRALELREYQTLPAHESGFFARRFGISQNEEEKCLELLIRSGQVERCGARLRLNESSVVDTRHDPVRSRQLRAFYSDVAKARLLADQEGDFSFNLFGVSKKDLERLRVLQRDHFAEMRRIIAESEPVEAVVLMNMHLVPLA